MCRLRSSVVRRDFCGAGRMGCSFEALKPKDEDAQRFWARCGFGPLRGFAAFHRSPQRRVALLAALADAAAGRLTVAQCAEVGARFGSEATTVEAVWVCWL